MLIFAFLPAILTLSCTCPDGSHIKTFDWKGRQYEVRFAELPNSNANLAWPQDLVLRWRKPGAKKWHVVSRIPEVRPEKEVKLSDAKGREIYALVVSSPGGSAQFISVVEIDEDPPSSRRIKRLLKSAGPGLEPLQVLPGQHCSVSPFWA